jgi:hypothetical protein
MRRWIRGRAKSVLDRRYVRISDWDAIPALVDQLVDRVDQLVDRVDSATSSANVGVSFVADEDPNDLRDKLLAAHRLTRETADVVASLAERATIGASFVAHEDPHELRKKLFAAHRLATESAIGIESLLQSEILLWQAVDNVAVVGGSISSGAASGNDGESLAAFGQHGMSIRLITNSFTVSHPALNEDIHPDLLALATAIVVAPWVGSRLDLNVEVSDILSRTVRDSLGFEVGPVDSSLTGRPDGGELGLLFSGGVDSMAALSVLPATSPLIHLRRVRHSRIPDRATHLRTNVNVDIAAAAGGEDRPFHVVDTDLEFLCGPYPTYGGRYTLAIGAVLLADVLDLGGIVRGTTIEGRWLQPNARFNAAGSTFLSWRGPFLAAGIPLTEPTSGASEVVLMRAVRESGMFDRTRSCQLGPPERSCQHCVKCYRKELIISATDRSPLPKWAIDNAASDERFQDLLTKGRPMDMQHIYEYALPRVEGLEGSIYGRLNSILGSTEEGTEWVGGFYRAALDDLTPRWADIIVPKISQLSRYMTTEEEIQLEAWSATPADASLR